MSAHDRNKNKNLTIFLFGTFISGLGTKLTTIALAGKVLKLTGSDFSISLVFLFQSLPMLLLGVPAGNFVEKRDKRGAYVVVNLLFAVTSLILALSRHTPVLYAAILLNGVLFTVSIPARVALLPLLVENEDLPGANGYRMSVNGAVMALGYALAGVVVAAVGDTAAFLLDSLSFVLIACSCLFLQCREVAAPEGGRSGGSYRKDIGEGWNYIRRSPTIKHVFALDLITNFIISMQVPLTYLFVKYYLGGQALMAQRTGFLFSAAGIGSIVGGMILGRFRRKNKLYLLSLALIFDSTLVTAFSLNRYFPVSVLIFSAMGILGSFTGSILETVVQQQTPANLLGRVTGFISSVVEPVCVISLLAGGAAAGLIGVRWVFLLGAAVELIAGAYFYQRFAA